MATGFTNKTQSEPGKRHSELILLVIWSPKMDSRPLAAESSFWVSQALRCDHGNHPFGSLFRGETFPRCQLARKGHCAQSSFRSRSQRLKSATPGSKVNEGVLRTFRDQICDVRYGRNAVDHCTDSRNKHERRRRTRNKPWWRTRGSSGTHLDLVFPPFRQAKTSSAEDTIDDLEHGSIGMKDSRTRPGCFSIRRLLRRTKHVTRQGSSPDSHSDSANFTLLARREATRTAEMRQLPNYILRLSDRRSRTVRTTTPPDSEPRHPGRLSSQRERLPDHRGSTSYPYTARSLDNYSANVFDLSPTGGQHFGSIVSDDREFSSKLTTDDVVDESETFRRSVHEQGLCWEESSYSDVCSDTTTRAVYHGNSGLDSGNRLAGETGSSERLSRKTYLKFITNLIRAKRHFLRADNSQTVLRTLAVL